MEASDFDETEFFRAIAQSGARAMLIGRRAMILYGLPVLTADYDFWLHVDDIAAFNEAVRPLGLVPGPRTAGKYVLENDERVDVFIARSMGKVEGLDVTFEDVWERRESVEVTPGITVFIPTRDDLIALKKIARRPKDLEDIRLLELLPERGHGTPES